ncbi:MAG: hypothetical protein L0206_17320 [Actinobacteria bacterium]|nr:hypothetical protein [Actinomycetota bacterium]
MRADIHAGHPSPLGLVRVKSADPSELKRNHQVLAYGYDHAGTDLTLRLYDPNHPREDDVTLSIDIADPSVPATIVTSPAGRTVFSFFRVPYEPATPP